MQVTAGESNLHKTSDECKSYLIEKTYTIELIKNYYSFYNFLLAIFSLNTRDVDGGQS